VDITHTHTHSLLIIAPPFIIWVQKFHTKFCPLVWSCYLAECRIQSFTRRSDMWNFSIEMSELETCFLISVESTALGPTQPPIQWVPGDLSLGIKRPGREAHYSPPSSAEVKEWVELYLHCPNKPSLRGTQLKKHRDNFTFTFTFTLRYFTSFNRTSSTVLII
jgi:hypothetical protein